MAFSPKGLISNMLKPFFSLTILRYPLVVKVTAALIFIAASGALLLTNTDWGISASILAVITVVCVISFILASFERYYVLSVLMICAVHMGLIAYVGVNYYLLNATPVYMSALIDITLAGLLLGGLGATIVTAYDLVLLIIGEIVMFSGKIPVPVNAPIVSHSNQISGASINVSIILVVYFIVVFFTYMVRKGQLEGESQRSVLASTNLVLLSIQAEELRLGQQVSALAQRASASIEQQSAAAQGQANQSTHLATALTELEQNIQLINKASQDVKQAVNAASTDALGGKDATDKAVAALTNISATVEQMAQQITNLSEQARQVNTVLDIINEVASETHMLALNAAIEAASAGDHGTRFSVIADEIGSVAERTHKAVNDIDNLVRKIEEAANQAIEISSYGLVQSKESTALTSAAGVAHQNILISVDNTATLIQSIAAATDQQSRASESAVTNVEQLSLTAKQAAQASEDLVGVAHELTIVANNLVQRSASNQPALIAALTQAGRR